MKDRVLAVVKNYDELHAAMRARMDELGIVIGHHSHGKTMDETLGLPDGYVTKLMAPGQLKRFGMTSLGLLLSGFGCKLILVVDEVTLAQITRKLKKRDRASTAMPAQRKRKRRHFLPFRRSPELARQERARQLLAKSPEQRRRDARKAALARWSAPRKPPGA